MVLEPLLGYPKWMTWFHIVIVNDISVASSNFSSVDKGFTVTAVNTHLVVVIKCMNTVRCGVVMNFFTSEMWGSFVWSSVCSTGAL